MSTEELTKSFGTKMSTLRDILNSQYGGFAVFIAVLWTIGKLSPDEYEQTLHFVSSTIDQLKNPSGLLILTLFILIYINKSFFQKYLEKEKNHSAVLSTLESTLSSFSSQCSLMQHTRREDDITLSERLGNVEGGVSMLLSNLSEHAAAADKITSVLELQIIPSVTKIVKFVDER